MKPTALRPVNRLAIAIPAIKLTERTVGQYVARRKLDTQLCVDQKDETGPRPSELMVVIVDDGSGQAVVQCQHKKLV